jgi:hypothetical protein
MQRENRFIEDYVRHLPEVGPEVLGRPGGGVFHMVCAHDEWCRIDDGADCNCSPDIRFFAEPERS